MIAVIDENIPYIKGVLEPFFDVHYLPGSQIIGSNVVNADALVIRTRTRCNAQLLSGSKVQFIGSATIGADHVDADYCANHGIRFVNAPGCNSAGVQQWVLSAIVEWARREGVSLRGLTLGVVGVGNVGKKVAKSAAVLGLRLLCCDPPRRRAEDLSNFVAFEEVMANSDIVTFHVPLNRTGIDSTFHLVNAQSLSLCKPNVFLLNSSRGEVVNTSDVVSFAGTNGRARFAFDVWENEPNISESLLSRSTIATTHIAGYSVEGKVNGTRMVVDALSQHFGLNIHPWLPSPNPCSNRVLLPNDLTITESVEFTYRVTNDDIRHISKGFEDYRNSYSYRHDFSGYIVPDGCKFSNQLCTLGFMKADSY